MSEEEIKNEFINCIEGTHTLNLAISVLEDREELRNRIDKAIEYIEEKYDYILGDDTFLDHDERLDRKQMKHIIDILKGEENE